MSVQSVILLPTAAPLPITRWGVSAFGRDAALRSLLFVPPPRALQARGAKPAPESGLGSFMFVKNSRFDAAKPSPDSPRFWVGRVAEIMRGGRIRLHWHRETALGSGAYVPTNNYFPERAALLRAFQQAVFDAERREWRVHPALELAEDVATAARWFNIDLGGTVAAELSPEMREGR